MIEGKAHTQRPLQELKIDLSQFSSGYVSELIARVTDVSVGVASYREILTTEAGLAESQGKNDQADSLQFLLLMVGMTLKPGDASHPFQPTSWVGHARSPIPDDFTDEQINNLVDALAHVTDSRLAARLSDIAWVRLRRIDTAYRAIDAYLEAACDCRMIELERYWCLERAFRLARQTNSGDYRRKCVGVYDKFKADSALYQRLNVDMLSLAKDMEIEEPAAIAEAALSQGHLALEQDPRGAEQLFSLAASLFTKLGDKQQSAVCHRKVAERYLELAQMSDPLQSLSFIENAFDALKRAGASKVEIQEIAKLHTSKGQGVIALMNRIEGARLNFTNQVKVAREFVRGVEPIMALKKVALQFPVLSYNEHKVTVEESIKKNPLMHFIEAKEFSSQGRQVSRRPSFLTDDTDEFRLAMDTEVWTNMVLQHQILTRFSLMPALREIQWRTRDFVQLGVEISFRPIVPPDRADLFFVGIRAGLRGDFCEAAHILMPQVENSLRFLLEAKGYCVTQLGNDSLHSEMPLNLLVRTYRHELTELFGSSDLIYTMESFLCCKSGENFRNEMAHGLVSNVDDYRFTFAWWLIVYLLFILKSPDAVEE